MEDDEIVISGVSGRFPESRNVAEFEANLMSGMDMVTDDSRRWPVDKLTEKLGLPRRSAKLLEVDKFDAQAFGLPPKQVNCMDPQMKILIEVAFETLVDAGLNPMMLKGEKFGVYVATAASETNANMMELDKADGYQILGCDTSMFASRINYTFGLTGPSFSVNSACSSSLTALSTALDSIKRGVSTGALVCGAHLQLLPQAALHLHRLNMTSKEGYCRSFDADGKGYVRAETVGAVLLQRRKDAKRCYATVMGARINTDGYKPQGIFFPNGLMQRTLLREFYEEVKIDPGDVEYVEAHGTGTQVGDPQEAYAIAATFCEDRSSPLWVGSVKSNMGHAENAAGLCQLAKCLIIMERGTIPPNLHFNNPNKHIEALVDGRLNVPTSQTKYNGGMIAINSFGFGGVNTHVLIKPTPLNTQPAAASMVNGDHDENVASLPKLYCFCGRNEEMLGNITKAIQDNVNNDDAIALILSAFGSPQTENFQRGFALINHGPDLVQAFSQPSKSRDFEKPPIWFVYSGMGTQWNGMARDLMPLPCFRRSIEKCADSVRKFKVNLIELLTNESIDIENSPMNSFLTIAAMQIALTDILTRLGISPSGIIGHSFGELSCGYADGSLTLEQTMAAAYIRGECITEARMDKGAMAAVADSWDSVVSNLPEGVYLACDNADDSITISGNEPAVLKAVDMFKQRGVFADTVKCASVAFHTPEMVPIAANIEHALSKYIKSPQKRSERWISTSDDVSRKDESRLKEASAWYFANNLVTPVKFANKLKLIPSNAVVIEISPHAIFLSILTRSLPKSATVLGLMSSKSSDKLIHLLSSVGRLHNAGVEVAFRELYPIHTPSNWPVPRGTLMLAPLVAWNHQESWPTVTYESIYSKNDTHITFEIEPFNDSKNDTYLCDHLIQGRNLFPMMGYIELVWRGFCQMRNYDQEKTPVWLQNIKLHQATFINPQKKMYRFEVYQVPTDKHIYLYYEGTLVMESDIEKTETSETFFADMVDLKLSAESKLECQSIQLNTNDIYKQAMLRGYDFGHAFQLIQATCNDGHLSKLKWSNNWVTFIDAMAQTSILRYRNYNMFVPVSLSSMRIDPVRHAAAIEVDEQGEFLKCYSNKGLDLIYCGGVEFRGLQSAKQPRILPKGQNVTLEKQLFVPYFCDNSFANYPSLKQKAQEEMAAIKNSLIGDIVDVPDDSCLVSCFSNSQILSSLLYLVITNRTSNHLKYCQINPKNNLYQENVCKLVSMHPQKETEPSTVVLVENSEEPMELDNTHSTSPPGQMITVKFDPTLNSFPTRKINMVGSLGLVILDRFLSCFSRMEETLEFANGLLANDGFLLVTEITGEFEAFDIINKIKHHPNLKRRLALKDWLTFFKSQNLRVCAYACDSDVSWLSHFLLKPVGQCEMRPHKVVDMDDIEHFGWLQKLQEEIKKEKETNSEERIWLTSTNPANAILSLVLSIQMENKNIHFRCAYTDFEEFVSEKKSRKTDDYIFTKENLVDCVEADMLDNAYLNSVRGFKCFVWLDDYVPRHLVTNAYMHPKTLRNLSSIDWIQNNENPDHSKYAVYYSALNFKDIMLSTGKLNAMHIPGIDLDFENIGCEFSGRSCTTGERIFGMPVAKGLATYVYANELMVWKVPDKWSMAEAATVPVAYLTAYYALICRGRLQPKDTVLIHSGTGGVGQAALNIALSMDCNIFTTVGSHEKRQFIMNNFPQIDTDHIGDSRSSSFLMMVLKLTNGRGADVILNSLAFEKLQNSLKCLALNGRFLELGKTDLITNSAAGLGILLRNVDIIGIVFETLLQDERQILALKNVFLDGIERGVVKPIKQLVYHHTKVDEAFRLMAQGKHIGKVLIQIREDDSPMGIVRPPELRVLARSSLTCSLNDSVLITGGLGGLGIETAQWLVDKGIKRLFLTSRVGIKTGYQKRVVAEWRKRGVYVEICLEDIGSKNETILLLERCNNSGNFVGIFHLAQSSKDGMIENQTVANFKQCAHMKQIGTQNLDEVSRIVCPNLKMFVVFSSYASGRGSRGQSSYAWGNGCAEQVVKRRRAHGYCGTAIQWGAIGDVGMYMNVLGTDNTVVMRTLHMQRVFSVLESMETLIFADYPIVSSFIKAKSDSLVMKKSSVDDLLNKIKQIFGALSHQDVDQDTKFGQLGLDSLMVVEMQDIIEKDYGVLIPHNQLRELTLNDIKSMLESEKVPEIDNEKNLNISDNLVNFFGFLNLDNRTPSESIEKLNDLENGRPLFLIHGNDLTSTKFKKLANLLQFPVYGLQVGDDMTVKTYEQMAEFYIERMQSVQKHGPYRIAAYSIGSPIGIIMANLLKNGTSTFKTANNKRKKRDENVEQLIIIDGSFKYYDIYCEILKRTKNLQFNSDYSDEIDDYLLNQVRLKLGQPEDIKSSIDTTGKQLSWRLKLDMISSEAVKVAPNLEKNAVESVITKQRDFLAASYRYKHSGAIKNYEGDAVLIRCQKNKQMTGKLGQDLGLKEYIKGDLKIMGVPGSHESMILAEGLPELAQTLNHLFGV